MTTPAVKICGLTRVDDALAALDLGATHLGMVFFPGSARCVSTDRARAVAEAVRRHSGNDESGRPKLVGIFVNQEVEEMVDIADAVGLDLLQLHGSESPNIAAKTRRPYMKAFRIDDTPPYTDGFEAAEWLLFDAYSPVSQGGTGKSFRWELLDAWPRSSKFFLAGGLTPDNVAAAIRQVRPDGIDVSTGVEDGPGLKNVEKMKKLFEAIRGA